MITDRAGTIAVSPPARAVDLAGLAELTAALSRAAAVPGTLVVIDGDLTDGEACTHLDTCTRLPQITVAADLATDTDQTRLYGALAHEIAHRALGHLSTRRPWRTASQLAGLVTVAALVTGYPWTLGATTLAVALTAHLADARRQRQEELAADAHSVRLLDAVGLPGLDIAKATVRQLPRDGWWYRTLGWIGGHHPTVTRRHLALLIPPRRLRWASIGVCLSTGHRVGTAGHRHAHRVLGGPPCRPTGWRLLPTWHRPAL